jgi:glutamate-1-semialdehyde 2,1-aminomutase
MRVLPYHPPLVASHGEGCRIWDVDGNEYIDLNMAYGPLLFGHRPRFVIDAVVEQLRERGSILGFPQALNFEVGEKIKHLYPSIELLRFANSGSEAVATTVRLARAFTGRDGLLLFEGNYHGWNDAVFHRCHVGLNELPTAAFSPAVAGTPGMNGRLHGWTAQFNVLESVRACLERHGAEIGAILLEPVMGNAGVIPPADGFLAGLRELADEFDCLLIFDEVITGLRVAPGGAQQRFGVRPDLTVLSKALGGGFPLAAFGGRADILELLVNRTVFHGGVYSGNAAVLSAANAVLDRVIAGGAAMYDELERRTRYLATGMENILTRHDVPHVAQQVGAVMGLYLTREPTDSLDTYRAVVQSCDFEGFIQFQHRLLEQGVYIHPNQFEVQFVSTAHQQADLDECLARFERAAAVFAGSRVTV